MIGGVPGSDSDGELDIGLTSRWRRDHNFVAIGRPLVPPRVYLATEVPVAAGINHHPPGIFSTVHGDGKRRIGRDYTKVANRKKNPVATLKRP